MILLRALLALLALLAAAAIAAGCGGDDETTVTETVSSTVQETETGASTEALPPTETTTPTSGKRGPKYFQSPSGNIGCYMDTQSVRCDIRERDWEPPPDPARKRCEEEIGLDYGGGIALGATHAEFICAGDTTLGGPNTLEYGQSSQRGPFVCESGEQEMVCSHTGNGHGFSLSRQGYRIF